MQSAPTYRATAEAFRSKKGKRYDRFRIRRKQEARRLRGKRTAFRSSSLGHTEVTIPVRSRAVPSQDKIIVESVVIAAPTANAPSTKEVGTRINSLEDDELRRLLGLVSDGKELKGRDRLGYGKGAEYWHLEIRLEDNAASQAFVDDLFGHEVTEAKPVELGAFTDVRVAGEDGPAVYTAELARLFEGSGTQGAGEDGAQPPPGTRFFDFERFDSDQPGIPGVTVITRHEVPDPSDLARPAEESAPRMVSGFSFRDEFIALTDLDDDVFQLVPVADLVPSEKSLSAQDLSQQDDEQAGRT